MNSFRREFHLGINCLAAGDDAGALLTDILISLEAANASAQLSLHELLEMGMLAHEAKDKLKAHRYFVECQSRYVAEGNDTLLCIVDAAIETYKTGNPELLVALKRYSKNY